MLSLLAVAAALAGATGSWSPCGLSMIDTLGPRGHARGRWWTAAACAAFVPGALSGGVVTFGGLALVGSALGPGEAVGAAAALALLVAAGLELRGVPIAPQIRRQVPERWRRATPLPVASAGYGVLLGMGFTTYVLTFAVPALAAVCLALGDPLAGLVVGLAFGAGRALPIVVLAPLARSRAGLRATDLMVQRPAVLRGFRAADALALAGCAAVLGADSAAALGAVALMSPAGTDPSAAGEDLAWQTPGGTGRLQAAGDPPADVGASHPALGGSHLALRSGDLIRVVRRADGGEVLAVSAAGQGPVAVSDRWLVLRFGDAAGDRLEAVALDGGARRVVAVVAAPAQLGRPALEGDRLVFHVAATTRSELREIDLASGAERTLRTPSRGVYLNPSLHGERLLYVSSTASRQQLLVGDVAGGDDTPVYGMVPTARRDAGHEAGRGRHRVGYRDRRPPSLPPRPRPGVLRTLWTTALTERHAYVARLRHLPDGTTESVLLRVDI